VPGELVHRRRYGAVLELQLDNPPVSGLSGPLPGDRRECLPFQGEGESPPALTPLSKWSVLAFDVPAQDIE